MDDVPTAEVEREMAAAAIDLLADAGRGYTDHSEQAYEDAARALIHDIDGIEWADAGWETGDDA